MARRAFPSRLELKRREGCLAGADDPVVRPDRGPHPLPLLEDVGVCLLDQSADPAERLAAPVAELGDSLADQLRRRLAFLPGPGAFHRRLVGMIRIYHYRHQRKLHQRKLGVPLSAYPTALLRVVLSCWEAVAETALLPKSFQMVAEGGFSEAVDRHRMAVPDDAVADLLPDSGRLSGVRVSHAWRKKDTPYEGSEWPKPAKHGNIIGIVTATDEPLSGPAAAGRAVGLRGSGRGAWSEIGRFRQLATALRRYEAGGLVRPHRSQLPRSKAPFARTRKSEREVMRAESPAS